MSKGEYLYNAVRGLHFTEINTDRKRQSYGHEITFNREENDISIIYDELKKQSKQVKS